MQISNAFDVYIRLFKLSPLSTKGVYIRPMIIHLNHQKRLRLQNQQSGNCELIKNLHFNYHGHIYTFIIQVSCLVTKSESRIYYWYNHKVKNPNNYQATKCSCNMRYWTKFRKSCLSNVYIYIYIYIYPWLSKEENRRRMCTSLDVKQLKNLQCLVFQNGVCGQSVTQSFLRFT